ncbi:Uncharacterized protein pbN1_00690 [Aromatoleum bremense]|nr:Uncharacterized protein pbN1_00690 [Aromatoleum bremense]
MRRLRRSRVVVTSIPSPIERFAAGRPELTSSQPQVTEIRRKEIGGAALGRSMQAS